MHTVAFDMHFHVQHQSVKSNAMNGFYVNAEGRSKNKRCYEIKDLIIGLTHLTHKI